MPTGNVDLVINLLADRIRVYESPTDSAGIVCGGSIVHGAQSRAFVLDDLQQVYFVGVHFKPGGAMLLGVPANELTDGHVSLEDLWGVRARELRQRLLDCATPHECFSLLERELLARLSSRVLVHPAISFALRSQSFAEPSVRVAKLRRESGYSERRFTHLFAQAVGLTPKKYLRVKRLAGILRELARRDEPLAHVAAAYGYFDQAHFVRDFRELTGVTPSAYRPMERSELHMEAVLGSRL